LHFERALGFSMRMSGHHSTQEDLDRLLKAWLSRESLKVSLQFARYIAPHRGVFLVDSSVSPSASGMGRCFPLLAGGLINAALHPAEGCCPVLAC
jgi:hypothetical protein